MNARRIGLIAAVFTLVASGAYVFIYLYRWEWNRAQVAAAIFIAVEIALIGWILADRLRRIDRRLDDQVKARSALEGEQRRLNIIRSSAPTPRSNFEWLTHTDRDERVHPGPPRCRCGAVRAGVDRRASRPRDGRPVSRAWSRP